MATVVDRLFGGSRFEPVAKELFVLFGPKGQAFELRDNSLMMQIMSHVLTKTSNCVDVGSHHGDFLEQFLRLAPLGSHVAFEPLTYLAERLRHRFPTVDVRQAALSDSNGWATFHHVVSNPGYSGLRQRSYDRRGEVVETIQVETQRLDDALTPGVPIHLLKVDVEGAEFQVFRGAIETLKANKPWIIFEHGHGASDHYGTTPRMIYDLLVGECDLRIFGLDGSGPLGLAEFVYIYEKNRAWNFLAHP